MRASHAMSIPHSSACVTGLHAAFDLNQKTLHSWVNVTLLIGFVGWGSQQKESIFRGILWVTPVSKGDAAMLCIPGPLGVIFLLRPANTTA